MTKRPLVVLTLVALLTSASAGTRAEEIADGLRRVDRYTLAGETHLVSDPEPTNSDGTINVVVEIPTGTVAKWEVGKDDGQLHWEIKNGEPRIVAYLGYPGNYGMIPRSLLAAEEGGDGDPLDVIVLGPPAPRGAVVAARLVGVLSMLDDGEIDDKLVAVAEGSPLAAVRSIEELNRDYPGVTTIVETWFRNYKGAGRIETAGFRGPDEARAMLDTAIATYARPRAAKKAPATAGSAR